MNVRLLLMILAIAIATGARAERVAYTDEAAFRNAVASLAFERVYESFEDDAVWGAVRSTVTGGTFTAPSVDSQGVTWMSNHAQGEITTGNGPARRGLWGFYSLPHGSFATGTDCDLPARCGDGIVGVGQSSLFAVSAWVDTNTPFAEIGLFLDGDLTRPVDFGEECDPNGENCVDRAIIGTTAEFFGVVDTAGFQNFEFRELEGVAEDQKFVFFDDFRVAFGSTSGDTDGDGVPNLVDNCTDVANPDQRDVNLDGYGNRCDPDLNNDTRVNFIDVRILRALLGSTNPVADLDGDGIVGGGDFLILRDHLFITPGPSGVAR